MAPFILDSPSPFSLLLILYYQKIKGAARALKHGASGANVLWSQQVSHLLKTAEIEKVSTFSLFKIEQKLKLF